MAYRLSIYEEREQRKLYPTFTALPEYLQQRLLRLARSKSTRAGTIKLTEDEASTLEELSGMPDNWLLVPCQGCKFGRRISYDTTKRRAWAM